MDEKLEEDFKRFIVNIADVPEFFEEVKKVSRGGDILRIVEKYACAFVEWHELKEGCCLCNKPINKQQIKIIQIKAYHRKCCTEHNNRVARGDYR